MPIANIQDAHEVERGLQTILTAPDADGRAREIRKLFVETLDFDHADLLVALGTANDPNLPSDARLLARRDGFSVLYISLDNADDSRVKTATAAGAAKIVGDAIADEPLMLFTNRDCDQLHVIYPDLSGNRPRLQRMVAYRGQPGRTVVQQIANLWNDYGKSGMTMGEAIRNAFSVQPVTDAFFKDYKAAYDDAVSLIADNIEQVDAEQFTQTLFNRLLFVHFVGRKGWLKFNSDTDYLNALWQDYQASPNRTNFYRDRLSTLFFDGLNNPQSQNIGNGVQPLIGDVPFLNGGLFEETDLDRRAVNAVPDDAIVPLLTDIFNHYNFTVMEATPLDTEVAVDPEMLGKLFEETVNERHSNGAYYTPRRVVSFMCREAIKGYLSGKNIGGLTDAKIAELVDQQNHDAITPMQAPEIYEAVKNMKAVDPACGSGAFLLGMLQEILALNDSLFRALHTSESLYEQKLDIITKNIYGADKDPIAVSTAMLRLWLSLAVDYEGDGPPQPLPNLDLKLVAGDSIAGPDPQQFDFTRDIIAKSGLRDDIAAYTTAYGQQKDTFKQRVDNTKAQLRSSLRGAAPAGVVEWRIDFADVMLNGGFDVVIANPPYVQLQRNSGELANQYRSVGYKTFVTRGDIYQLFYERGCQLLKPDHGLLTYITSNSWLKAEYGKTTRRYFHEKHTPLLLLEMGKDVFHEATVDTSVLLLRHGQQGNNDNLLFPAVDVDKLDEGDFPPAAKQWGSIHPRGDVPWSILSATEQSVMGKMLAVGTPLKEWDITIYRGITTGLNEAFILDEETRAKLVASDPKSSEIIKPILRGRDIHRYQSNWANLWLIAAKFGSNSTLQKEYPALYEHLAQHEQQLRARGQCRYTRAKKTNPNLGYDGQHHWLELDNNPSDEYLETFYKEKLVWMDLTDQGRFTYDDSQMFCVNTVFTMTGQSLKYLCALLNSKLITWFMGNTALNSGMGVPRWIGHTVEQIPVPQISAAQQRPFIQLADTILAAKAADPAEDTSNDEAEIDRLVYGLYGVTEEETIAVQER